MSNELDIYYCYSLSYYIPSANGFVITYSMEFELKNDECFVYYIDNKYTSIYANLLENNEQIIFYWNKSTRTQTRPPKIRSNNQTYTDAYIKNFDDNGCILVINDKFYNFEWYKFPKNESVKIKGRLCTN